MEILGPALLSAAHCSGAVEAKHGNGCPERDMERDRVMMMDGSRAIGCSFTGAELYIADVAGVRGQLRQDRGMERQIRGGDASGEAKM